jgi:hypothetical protein
MSKTPGGSLSTSSRQHVHSASPSSKKRLESTDKRDLEDEDNERTDTDVEDESAQAIELNVCARNAVGSQDDGACLFLAIDEAFPDTLSISDLDKQIETLYKQGSNSLTKSQCGIPGDSWHTKCVHLALRAKTAANPSFKFTWARIKGKKEHELREFLLQKNAGKFIVIGIMNYRLIPGTPPYGNWKHAVLVDTDTGMIHDPAGCSGTSRENMTVVSVTENLPKSEGWEGWLTTIQAVYRFNVENATVPRIPKRPRGTSNPASSSKPTKQSKSTTAAKRPSVTCTRSSRTRNRIPRT